MTSIETLRAAGRLSIECEARLLRLRHYTLSGAKPGRARELALADTVEQVAHYEAACARVRNG